jgi:hypothetical protein
MPGTILLGVDVESASEASRGFAHYGAELYQELDIPVTWYLTGRTLEMYPDVFREIDRIPSIELQGHTYSHMLLKTVLLQVPKGKVIHGKTDWFLEPSGTVPEVEADLTRCQQVFEDVLERRATALTTPWAYYRGLGDRLDLLEIVHRLGFRVLRSFGRNEYDGQPVPFEWQPFFYRLQGYPDILEVFIHGYQDDFYWQAFVNPQPEERYEDFLRSAVDLIVERDLVWSLCSHDHHCDTRENFELKGAWQRELICYALDKGVRFMSISPFYEEMRAMNS